ncbi:DUF6297 family protein [Serinibacter salmoneus]|nr:DUF6297 family protein [Serinibacter salmoneus]
MSGAALRALTAKARRGHGGAGLGSLVGDAYTYLLTAVVAVAMAVSGAGVLGAELDTTTPEASAGVAWLWWVGSLAALGLLLGLLARLGPVGVGAPGALWWLTTPADRPGLLRPVLAGWLAATGVIGAVIGAAVAALVGAPLGTVGVAALGGAGAGVALAAAAALSQVLPGNHAIRGRRLALVGDLLTAFAVIAWIALTETGTIPPATPAVATAAALVILGVVLAVAAAARLGGISGIDLRERGARTGRASFAIVSLDLRELGRVLTDTGRDSRRRLARLGGVRGPVTAMVAADWLLLTRSPRQLAMLATSLGIPFAMEVAGGSLPLVLGGLVVGAYLAATAVGVGARAAEDAPALDRALGMSARATRAARLVLPSAVLLVWVLVTIVLRDSLGSGAVIGAATTGLGVTLIVWLPMAVLLAIGLAAAAVKAAYRKPPDWGGQLVVAPGGIAYPPGVITSLTLGPVLNLVATLPALVAFAVGPQPVLLLAQLIVSGILVAVAAHVGSLKK